MAERKKLYAPIEPNIVGTMKVSDVHTIAYEESGNKGGVPVVVLHGGPGGGCIPQYRQYFNPQVYRIIMFDQRGCGKSTPMGCLEENTTWDLVNDIEQLRELMNVEKWVVFGGSWGSTLSLTYAETHPDRVLALVLRGIFTLRREELLWFYQSGASFVYPDAWEKYVAPIPEAERHDFLNAYMRRLTSDDVDVRRECGKAWTAWEMSTSRLIVDPSKIAKADDIDFAVTFARIECHYFVNAGFYEVDGQLIKNAHKLSDIPTTIVQGRYDMVCPAKTAWDLHRALPSADLHIIPDAGHSGAEEGIVDQLVCATDKYGAQFGK